MLKKPTQLMAKCKWTSVGGDKISDHKPCVHNAACSYNCLHHIPIPQSRCNEQWRSTTFILNIDISSFADEISHQCGICLKTDIQVIYNTVYIYYNENVFNTKKTSYLSAISLPSQSNTL
jgi:hypothetical protein